MMPPTTPCIVLCGDSSETLFVPRLHPVHAWCEWFVECKHAWALCGTSELSIDLRRGWVGVRGLVAICAPNYAPELRAEVRGELRGTS